MWARCAMKVTVQGQFVTSGETAGEHTSKSRVLLQLSLIHI